MKSGANWFSRFTVAAEERTRIYGEYLPLDWPGIHGWATGKFLLSFHALGLILPESLRFNFPLNLVAHKVKPPQYCQWLYHDALKLRRRLKVTALYSTAGAGTAGGTGPGWCR